MRQILDVEVIVGHTHHELSEGIKNYTDYKRKEIQKGREHTTVYPNVESELYIDLQYSTDVLPTGNIHYSCLVTFAKK